MENWTHQMELAQRNELQEIATNLGYVAAELGKKGLLEVNEYERDLEVIRRLLDNDDWPIALDPDLICNTEEKTKKAATAVLTLLVSEDLKNKRFLDFGCGAGHVVVEALKHEVKTATGYDLDLSKCKFNIPNFFSDLDKVNDAGPYDLILMHDVLDHAVGIPPVEILAQANNLLAKNGRLYLRNHPWCSRHGGHIFEQKNKAFLHLVLDEIELIRVAGLQTEPNVRVLNPIETYRDWINKAGFNIISETPIITPVENFFLAPSRINSRIQKHWHNTNSPQDRLEVDFVEYILQSKDSACMQLI
jgi:SAM-dependent methyltransferase